MKNWLPKWKRPSPAANATMWMASPATTLKPGPVRVTTVNQEIRRYLELFFGGLCLLLLAISLIDAWRGASHWRTPLLIFGFVAVNLGLYHLALRSPNPLRLIIAQTLLGWVLCPTLYLAVDGVAAPWWPGYAVMGLSGAIFWGLVLPKPIWGRLVLLSYLINMAAATWLGLSQPNWREFALRAGILGIVGLMLVQLTAILSQSLDRVYERSLQHRKAKEELQELTRLKTDFFANISHEFRTPITLTLGPLEAVIKGRYGEMLPEIQPQLELMIRNQQRLLGLINQILDVSKAEAGALELKANRVPDLNRFIQERVEQFRPMIQERGLELRTSFDPLVPGMELYVDPEKFDKILFNLLSNALKFTKQGFLKVTTEIEGDWFLLEVSDSGIGIKDTELPHIFDRFRQADGSSTREFAGTGLGLTLVQELTKLHGGEVSAQSRYGHGTTFRVKLPLGRAHLSAQAIVDAQETGEKSAAAPVTLPSNSAKPERYAELNAESERVRDPLRPTVLCTEDNPDLMYFLRDLLIDSYNVFVAPNGQEGLAQAKQRQPDLILSDMMMPVMDGIEFCRRIREDPALRATPFVLLTARSMLESKIEGLNIGADDYLTKPFSESELLARAKNLIALRQQQLKLKRELEAARAIQISLLPPAPQRFDGVDLDFFYQPSDELSGDFCDIVRKGSWVYFYLADVTSHGTASAQVTYLLKEIFSQSIAKHALAEDFSLAELVMEAQRHYAEHRLEYDVAIQVARYHPEKRLLEMIRGNAPSPLRIGSGQVSQPLRVPPSPALSFRNQPDSKSFTARAVSLEAGDAVYFFTDGCYEFPAEGREFGLKRLHELLGATQGDDWKQIIFSKLVQANGSRTFPDDVTFLRLRITDRA